MDIPTYWIVAGSIIIILIAVFTWLYYSESLWLQALVSGAPVNPLRLILMHMRNISIHEILKMRIRAARAKVRVSTSRLESLVMTSGLEDAKKILEAAVKARQAGIKLKLEDELQAHLLSGGNIEKLVDTLILAGKADLEITTNNLASHDLAHGDIARVVEAMITAKKASIPLDFNQAAAIDLAKRDILEAVQMWVNPKVIKTPEPVTAMAKDGIQLTATARVTVKTDLDELVGGAGEETILARVGEAIVSAIGSAEHHKEILEDPSIISNKIPKEELAKGTAFEVLSVDIADIDVGENIGAKLKIEEAEADKKVAQARMEQKEQEMKVKILEMRAKVLQKEAFVHESMAEAFKKGKLGVMDYYKMKNLKADTEMRQGIASNGKNDENGDEVEEA